jgi:hypothetical protein
MGFVSPGTAAFAHRHSIRSHRFKANVAEKNGTEREQRQQLERNLNFGF